MNDELTFLRAARPELPLPSRHDLASVRHELQREIRRESRRKTRAKYAAGGEAPRERARTRTQQFSLRLGVIVTAASVLIAAVLILPQSSRTGLGPTSALADPVQVLHDAANAARNQPDVTPKPGQYYYVRTGATSMWFSIDGEHQTAEWDGRGQVVIRCNGTVANAGTDGSAVSGPCGYSAAYDPTLPITAEAMTQYLRDRVRSDLVQYVEPGRAEELIDRWQGGFVQHIFETQYLRAPVRAALYEAVTQLMTVQLITSAVPDGTVGVSFDHGTSALLFSSVSHQYVGYLSTERNAARIDEYASGLVDRVGQIP